MRSGYIFGKSFADEVNDCIKAATTAALMFTFYCGSLVYRSIANQVAVELDREHCGSLANVLFDGEQCPVADKIVVINSGAAFVEGGIITYSMIFVVVMAFLCGSGRWAWHQYQKYAWQRNSRNLGLTWPLMEGEEGSDLEDEDRIVVHKDWMKKFAYKGLVAYVVSYVAAALTVPFGLMIMDHVGLQILRQEGCHQDYFATVMWGGSGGCTVPQRYFGMTAFTYLWMISTWTGYAAWALTMHCLMLPKNMQAICGRPFDPMIQKIRQTITGYSTSPYWQDMYATVKLTVYSAALLVFYTAVIPVLNIGLQFSNDMFASFGCEDGFVATLFKDNLESKVATCTPLVQIIAMDAFPTQVEIFIAFPLAFLTITAGSGLGVLLHLGLQKTSLDRGIVRAKIDAMQTSIDEMLAVGKKTCWLFVPFSGYCIIYCAIPKANNLLRLKGCDDIDFPVFMVSFVYRTGCSILTVYRAVVALVSTQWVAFSYSLVGFGAMGVLLSGSHKAATSIKALCSGCDGIFSGRLVEEGDDVELTPLTGKSA